MRTRRGILIIVLSGLAALILLGWFWNRFAVVPEDAMPDHFELGRAYVGSTVEFSARFLDSSRKHPVDAAFERIAKSLPQAWSSLLSKVHPKNFRSPPGQVDLSKLKPMVQSPAFIRVEKILPTQGKGRSAGRPFVVLHLSVDTSRPGKYSGAVTLTLDHRRASLPVHITIEG
jgi:hypothetical protein